MKTNEVENARYKNVSIAPNYWIACTSNLSISVQRPCHKNFSHKCYSTISQGRKCESARQTIKFPGRTSEVNAMDTNGARYEIEWK